ARFPARTREHSATLKFRAARVRPSGDVRSVGRSGRTERQQGFDGGHAPPFADWAQCDSAGFQVTGAESEAGSRAFGVIDRGTKIDLTKFKKLRPKYIWLRHLRRIAFEGTTPTMKKLIIVTPLFAVAMLLNSCTTVVEKPVPTTTTTTQSTVKKSTVPVQETT